MGERAGRAAQCHAEKKISMSSSGVVHVTQGPSVTRFEVHPEPGVKVNKITNLSDDIKLSLSARIYELKHRFQERTRSGLKCRTFTVKWFS
ncbi:DNA translocase FtsK [Bacillus sp. SL00103]